MAKKKHPQAPPSKFTKPKRSGKKSIVTSTHQTAIQITSAEQQRMQMLLNAYRNMTLAYSAPQLNSWPTTYTNFYPDPSHNKNSMNAQLNYNTDSVTELIEKMRQLTGLSENDIPVTTDAYREKDYGKHLVHNVLFKIDLDAIKGCKCSKFFADTIQKESDLTDTENKSHPIEHYQYCTIVSTSTDFDNQKINPDSMENGMLSTIRLFVSHEKLWGPTKAGGSARSIKKLPKEYQTSVHSHENNFQSIHIHHLERVMTFDHIAYHNGKLELDFLKPPKKLDTTILQQIVLPENTKHEICSVINQTQFNKILFEDWGLGEVIEYGRGMTLLFHGAPGTGKTYCAHKIAEGTKKKIMSLSAAELQTSEPGGMERNIKQAFATAKKSKAILFLDECDGLVASRKGMGMILSSEINALLTEIEKFEGILILATNRLGKLDPALERRISLIVEFPKPDQNARKEIWQRMIPAKLPLHADVVIDELAQFDLTGGQIKNVLLNAARLAVIDEATHVTVEHFSKALERVIEGQTSFKNKTTHI